MASESDSPQPVAWVAFADDGSESAVAVMHRDEAEEIAARHGWQIAPLYRSPVCPYVTGTVTRYCTLTPFTLTDAEREAVEYAAASIHDQGLHRMSASMVAYAATLRGLLERCSQFAKRESDRPQPIAKRESDRPQPIADARLAARLAALQQLSELDEELDLPRCAPNPHATPGECTYPPKCTETGGK